MAGDPLYLNQLAVDKLCCLFKKKVAVFVSLIVVETSESVKLNVNCVHCRLTALNKAAQVRVEKVLCVQLRYAVRFKRANKAISSLSSIILSHRAMITSGIR